MQDIETDALIAHLERIIREYRANKAVIRFNLELDNGNAQLITLPDGTQRWRSGALVYGDLKMKYTLPKAIVTEEVSKGNAMFIPPRKRGETPDELVDRSALIKNIGDE